MSGVSVRPGAFLLLLAVALAGAGSAAALVIVGEERGAGVTVAVAGGALLGAARRADRSPRFLLLEGVTERAVEAAVLGAIAWAALPDDSRLGAAAITALGASYTAAYFRVRAMGLGFRIGDAGVLRTAPPLMVAVGLVAGVVEISLWTVAVLSASILALEIVELGRRRGSR
jgi:hypothetical protein